MRQRRLQSRGMGPGFGLTAVGGSRGRRRRRRLGGPAPRGPGALGTLARGLVVLAVVAGIGAGVWAWRSAADARSDRRAAVERFAAAWVRGDRAAMWRALTPGARAAHPQAAFAASYHAAERAAGVERVRSGGPADERDGRVGLPVRLRTRAFGDLRGTIELPVSGRGADAGIDWTPSLRLPGLRRGEAVRRRVGRQPSRGTVLAADGTPLGASPLSAPIADGLERRFGDRLAGRPAQRLLFGRRVVARAGAVPGRSVRTTIRPGLTQTAAAALGARLGGVAVLRPRDGAVLALAGLAVSAPQPPGSTFKIVTVSAALQERLASPSSTYPVRTFATLSGVRLSNAQGESCGGSLTQAFAESCNSVFAPLGARLGAHRLVRYARRFGMGERPPVPGVRPSTISPPSRLPDSLAVGAAAIGQDRDLATPLAMASVGATIATGGRRARPRVTTLDPPVRRRVVSARVAREVRAMMIDVVRSGTGTAAAVPGVEVAGKTGTAELRPHSTDPRDADAWFVAFAPASAPRVAVAVMLVGAGFGGTAAAPIARQALQAGLAG